MSIDIQPVTHVVAPGGSLHAYFDVLVAQPGLQFSRGWRSQSEIDGDLHGQPPSNSVHYDAAMDAAKISVSAGHASIQQLRVTFPTASSGVLWWTWDFRMTSEWLANRGAIKNHKTFMLAKSGSGDNRRFEFRTFYNGLSCDIRPYLVGGSTESPYDRLAPQVADYILPAEKWVRWWARTDFDTRTISAWIADEDSDAVQIHDETSVPNMTQLNWFWLEFNSSQSRPGLPATSVGHFRNVVVTTSTPALLRPYGNT